MLMYRRTNSVTEENSRIQFSTYFAAILFAMYFVHPLYIIFHGLVGMLPAFIIWSAVFLYEESISERPFWFMIHLRKNELFLYFAWLAVLGVNFLLGRGVSGELIIRSVATSITCYLIVVAYGFSRQRELLFLMRWTVLVIGINVAMSIPTLLEGGLVVRMFNTSDVDRLSYYMKGIGTYSQYTAYGILFPLFIVLIFNSSPIWQVLILLCSIFIFIGVLLSSFLAATIYMFVGILLIVLTLFIANKSRMRFSYFVYIALIVIFIIFYLPIVFNTDSFNYILFKSIDYFQSVSTYGVMKGDFTDRGTLFQNSLNSLLNNIFFGVGPYYLNPDTTVIGSHATWVDVIAQFGILGFVFYLSFMMTKFVQIIKLLKSKIDYQLNIGRLIGMIVFSLAGIWSVTLFDIQIEGLAYLMLFSAWVPSPHIARTRKENATGIRSVK